MHGEVQRVLAMQRALDSGAWVAFFRLATHAPYLQGCLAHMYFRSVRAKALTVLASTGTGPCLSVVLTPETTTTLHSLPGTLQVSCCD
jgi:hypothetical protein